MLPALRSGATSRRLRVGSSQAASRPSFGPKRATVVVWARHDSSNGANGLSRGPGSSPAASIRAAVGIDLGTTTSAIAASSSDGRPVVVEDENGRAVIPSAVFIRQDGTVLVGDSAVAAAESDPANAFYGIKRLLGRSYREALLELDSEVGSTPPQHQYQQQQHQALQRRRLRSYSLVEGAGGRVEVACPALGRSLTPQEVSAHLIRHLVSRATAFLERQQEPQGGGVQVLDAVVTVPAHFGPMQRRAVMEATRSAGLQRVTLLQEPIAAALAYGFGSQAVPYDLLLVFDLGGGTLDLTIVEAFDGIMEVLSTSGDNYLGGDDFTAAVADWLIAQQQQNQQQMQLPEPPPDGVPPNPSFSSSSDEHAAVALSCQPTSAAAAPPQSPAGLSSAHTLAMLRVAERVKLELSEAETAARSAAGISDAAADTAAAHSSSVESRNGDGSDGSSGRPATAGPRNNAAVRVRLPSLTSSMEGVEGRPPSTRGGLTGADQVELTHGTFEELVRPLLRRIWWPLEEVATTTRTQLAGRLPPGLDPRSPEAPEAPNNTPGARTSSGFGSDRWTRASAASGSSTDMPEGPGRREGAAAWDFAIFAPEPGTAAAAAGAKKFVAPPRRLTGLVLVGAATRLPVVRDHITQVTGLGVRPGVDPEVAVALGAALHAGLMAGSVSGGVELNDGGYVAVQHGRASGFQTAAVITDGDEVAPGVPAAFKQGADAGGDLVWEP